VKESRDGWPDSAWQCLTVTVVPSALSYLVLFSLNRQLLKITRKDGHGKRCDRKDTQCNILVSQLQAGNDSDAGTPYW